MNELKIVVAVTALVQACQAPPNRATTPRLTASQCAAISAAERFVVSQGFTATPPTASTSELMSSNRTGFPLEQVLPMRRNSMKPHAVGISDGLPGGQEGWTVVFESTPEYLKRLSPPNDDTDEAATGVAFLVSTSAAIRGSGRGYLLKSIQVRLPEPEIVRKICQDAR